MELGRLHGPRFPAGRADPLSLWKTASASPPSSLKLCQGASQQLPSLLAALPTPVCPTTPRHTATYAERPSWLSSPVWSEQWTTVYFLTGPGGQGDRGENQWGPRALPARSCPSRCALLHHERPQQDPPNVPVFSQGDFYTWSFLHNCNKQQLITNAPVLRVYPCASLGMAELYSEIQGSSCSAYRTHPISFRAHWLLWLEQETPCKSWPHSFRKHILCSLNVWKGIPKNISSDPGP